MVDCECLVRNRKGKNRNVGGNGASTLLQAQVVEESLIKKDWGWVQKKTKELLFIINNLKGGGYWAIKEIGVVREGFDGTKKEKKDDRKGAHKTWKPAGNRWEAGCA